MKYYLVKSGLNWADEIDFEGFDLLTEDELEKAKKEFKNLRLTVNASIGTNEDVDIESSEVLEDLRGAQEITESEYNFLNRLFSKHYGETPYNNFIESPDYEDYLNEIEEEKRAKEEAAKEEKRKQEQVKKEKTALKNFEKLLEEDNGK